MNHFLEYVNYSTFLDLSFLPSFFLLSPFFLLKKLLNMVMLSLLPKSHLCHFYSSGFNTQVGQVSVAKLLKTHVYTKNASHFASRSQVIVLRVPINTQHRKDVRPKINCSFKAVVVANESIFLCFDVGKISKRKSQFKATTNCSTLYSGLD